jgi:ASC-1-like (ASCH) protein
VLLIKSKVVDFIIEGIKSGENKIEYKVYDNTTDAHADLPNVLRSGDTILFQNDWTENYF